MVQVLFFLFLMCSSSAMNAMYDNQAIVSDNTSKTAIAQRQRAHEFLASAYYQNKDAHIITDHEWQELECDQLVKKINHTQTIFGLWGLSILARPVYDLSIIKQRQSRVKTLVDNPLLRLQLVQILQVIKDNQDELMSYWDRHDDLNKEAVDLYYHMFGELSASVDSKLNRNRVALEGAALFYLLKSVTNIVASLGVNGMVCEYFTSYGENRKVDWWTGIKEGIKRPITSNSIYPVVFTNGYKESLVPRAWAIGNAGDNYIWFHEGYQVPKIPAKLLAGMYVGISDALFVYNVRQQSIALKKLFDVVGQLHMRMVKIARLIKAIGSLRTLLLEHEDVFGVDLINQLNLMDKSAKVQQLTQLLNTPTFAQSGGQMYLRGRVLLAHQLLQDIKHELIPTLQKIAFIDAYHSVAQLYNDQSSRAPLCFAQFIQSESPNLDLDHFWTPLIPSANPVLNSITWNSSTHNKIILTGPSGAGKSTIMKSVAHSVLMAQAFGIAPAQKATLKLFTGLRSSLCPREDLQQSLSTFMAEKLRIDQTRSFIKSYKPDDCFLVLLDEPYRGTVEVESNYRVCQLGKELAPRDHCMLIIATHLQGPIDLEQSTGVFANYQLRLDCDERGKFTRTFELIDGAALWWFNDAQKRRSFVDQLLDNH